MFILDLSVMALSGLLSHCFVTFVMLYQLLLVLFITSSLLVILCFILFYGPFDLFIMPSAKYAVFPHVGQGLGYRGDA